VRIEYAKRPENNGEYYFGTVWGSSYYYKYIRDDGYQLLSRCDVKEGNKCFQQVVLANGTCTDSFDYMRGSPISSSRYIYYDDEQYPQPTACPDSKLTGCSKFCSESDSNSCIIVDINGFVVQDTDGGNYTFFDPPSLEDFAVTKCDGNSIPAPQYDFCASGKAFPYSTPKCSYHMKTTSYGTEYEYYGIMTPDGLNHQYLKRIYNDKTEIVLCDSHGKNCYAKIMGETKCEDKYDASIGSYAPFFGWQFLYDSSNYPKETNCPDGTPGCFNYCSAYGDDSCIIADAYGRIVKKPGEDGQVYTFFDDDLPTMDMFEIKTCDETRTYPAPVDHCAVQEEFVPQFPECSFNVSVDKQGEIRDSALHYELSGIMGDEESLILKVKKDSSYDIFRCDVKNAFGFCYTQKGEPCSDPFYRTYYFFNSNSDLAPSSLMPPQAFMYNKTAYPVNINCLDGSDGCKQYCDFYGNCYIVNSAGYVVQDPELTNWTFYDEFSFDAFEMDTCDGKTHIPAPSANICDKPVVKSSSSAAGAASSTPTPASRTISSASVVKSTFTFVAIAVALALF